MLRNGDWDKEEGKCENSLELYLNWRKITCVQTARREVEG